MSDETTTELKLPRNYRRPSLAEFTGPGHNYPAEQYEGFFQRHEEHLSEQMTSGELTDEIFDAELSERGLLDADGNLIEDTMKDEDHDGLPDVLHVKSQVRAQANRTLRARHPTRHRFKQYLFGNPSLRLVRKRVLRVPATLVRQGLDELIAKEEAGILSVHAPNGQRVDLKALKAGRVSLAPAPVPLPLPNPPLDSAANDVPAGENMPQMVGGTFAGDPAAERAVADMVAEKAEEAAKKGLDKPLEITAADTSGTTAVSAPPVEGNADVQAQFDPAVDRLAMENPPADGGPALEAANPEESSATAAAAASSAVADASVTNEQTPNDSSSASNEEALAPDLALANTELQQPEAPAPEAQPDPAASRTEPKTSSKKGRKNS